MPKPTTTQLHLQIAEKLRSSINNSTYSHALPDATTLAAFYGASRVTVLKALRVLRAEAVLNFSRGRGIRINNTVPSDLRDRHLITKGNSSENLAEKFKQEIQSGTWKKGEALSKISFLSRHYKTSSATIVTALKNLSEDGLVHKRGKAWIIGLPQAAYRGTKGFSSVILLLCKSENDWPKAFDSPDLRAFTETFNSEAENHGIQLLVVLVDSRGSQGVLPGGKQQVSRVLKDLGTRYIGTLILPFESMPEEIQSWQRYLVQFRKPVLRFRPPLSEYIWIDHKLETTCMFGWWGSLKNKGAAALGWNLLFSLGHRHIGFPSLTHEHEKLIPIIQSCFIRDGRAPAEALHKAKSIAITSNKQWDYVNNNSLEEQKEKGIPLVRQILQQYLPKKNTRSVWSLLSPMEQNLILDSSALTPLLLQKNLSALIAVNDEAARRIFLWCRAAGVKIPKEMSLLSFDPSVGIRPFPISSIDLGQKRLGYKAFHFLLGDMSIQPTKNNQLWGGTALNHSASLGPPGSRDFSKLFRQSL